MRILSIANIRKAKRNFQLAICYKPTTKRNN